LPLSDILSPSVFSNTQCDFFGRTPFFQIPDRQGACNTSASPSGLAAQTKPQGRHRVPPPASCSQCYKTFSDVINQKPVSQNFFMAVINSVVNKAILFVQASNGKDQTYHTMEFTTAAKSLAIQAPG
jgi:hypothetical protein